MADAVANPRLGRQALRLALAGTLAFAFAEYQDWEFSFLAPMLAVQFLGALPTGIRLGQALAIPIILGGASFAALIVSTYLSGNPAIIESLNGKFRAECLNVHWFTSLDEMRPHSAIGNKPPMALMNGSDVHGPV